MSANEMIDIRRAVYWKLQLLRRAGVRRVTKLKNLAACLPAAATAAGSDDAAANAPTSAKGGRTAAGTAATSGGNINQQTRSWAAQMAEKLRAAGGQTTGAGSVAGRAGARGTTPGAAASSATTDRPAAATAKTVPAGAAASDSAAALCGGKQLPRVDRADRPQDFEDQLEALRQCVAQCTRCPELAAARTNTVFGGGSPQAELMMIGEAPGQDEDLQGVPFVGRSGKLLTDIITKGMKMRREDIYICNIIKCRPPSNRNPNPQEAANCRQYLESQIELIRPRVILCLGGVATHYLFDDPTPVGKMRGRWHDYRGIDTRATYHPSYLLRNYTKDARQKVWEDVLEVVNRLKALGCKV